MAVAGLRRWQRILSMIGPEGLYRRLEKGTFARFVCGTQRANPIQVTALSLRQAFREAPGHWKDQGHMSTQAAPARRRLTLTHQTHSRVY